MTKNQLLQYNYVRCLHEQSHIFSLVQTGLSSDSDTVTARETRHQRRKDAITRTLFLRVDGPEHQGDGSWPEHQEIG